MSSAAVHKLADAQLRAELERFVASLSKHEEAPLAAGLMMEARDA